MKTIAYFFKRVLFTALIVIGGCSQTSEFSFVGGNNHTLEEFKGQWIVLNFWAKWCAPCQEEIPELNQLAKIGKSKGIIVIGISFDPLDNEELKRIIELWKIEYPVIATDPMPVLPFELPRTLPSHYLINPQGDLVKKLVGKQDYNSFMLAIEQSIGMQNQKSP